MSADREWSNGRSENAARSVRANVTDCSSGESDISPEAWSTGKSENAARSLPAVAVDCSKWEASPAGWLEVVVSFDSTATPAGVFGQTLRLIHTLHEQYRRQGLLLEYDAARSRTEGEHILVALRLDALATTEQREQAVHITRTELGKLPGAKLERMEWAAKA